MNQLGWKFAAALGIFVSMGLLSILNPAEAVTFRNSVQSEDGDRIYNFDLEFADDEVSSDFSDVATPTGWTFTSITDGSGNGDFSGAIPVDEDLLSNSDWTLTGFSVDPGVWGFESGLPAIGDLGTDSILVLVEDSGNITADFVTVAAQGFFFTTDATAFNATRSRSRQPDFGLRAVDPNTFASSQLVTVNDPDPTPVPESSFTWGLLGLVLTLGVKCHKRHS